MTDRTSPDPTTPCDIVPTCPICDAGAMFLSTQSRGITICVCTACGTSLSVPDQALEAFRRLKGSASSD